MCCGLPLNKIKLQYTGGFLVTKPRHKTYIYTQGTQIIQGSRACYCTSYYYKTKIDNVFVTDRQQNLHSKSKKK
jgi:hypothetical protein